MIVLEQYTNEVIDRKSETGDKRIREEQYKEMVTNAKREGGKDQPRQIVSNSDQRLA